MTEVFVALITVAGIAIQAYFGESRQIKNLRARIDLVRNMPEGLEEARANLIQTITDETDDSITQRVVVAVRFFISGMLVFLGVALWSGARRYVPFLGPEIARTVGILLVGAGYMSMFYAMPAYLRLARARRRRLAAKAD